MLLPFLTILVSLGSLATLLLILLVFSTIKPATLAIERIINKDAIGLDIGFSRALTRSKPLCFIIILCRRLLLGLESIIYKYSFNLRYTELYLKM